ncbi:ABC transporter ATP-binding protein [Ancylobacter sp. MQZ15Z-1]|uniref:Spermidine/putrescine import ATP-binding protein PotA n=1 Tax=Ancylobacter mangrovi TaxID=2972472 RepID=A0A9X2PI04_9HYPH|nr:ABC transporter ATP-binding protein [Ancylobacter mangrovi]MCS0497461.1 ABC transporter ATP-binding protein [Ancylobacter mangrovi]
MHNVDPADLKTAAGAGVRLVGVSKAFRGTLAIDDISLNIEPGSFVSLLGPSGSGKTTTLNMIAGFVTPDAGQLLFDDKPITDIPPHKRNIGMVFQSYALFPHMTVFDNVAYPLRMRTKLRKDELGERVREALQLVRLSGFEDRYPRQLSGGQQQRVSMARALVGRPRLLLMDEPLGALDKKLRDELQVEIKEIHRKLGSTFIYVTHDQTEALTMSDAVVVMRNAQVAQFGSPREVYEEPENTFVASFLGNANLLPAKVVAADGQGQTVRLSNGAALTLPSGGRRTFIAGSDVMLLLRPEDLALAAPGTADSATLNGTLHEMLFFGDSYKLIVDIGSDTLMLWASPREIADLSVGAPVRVAWDAGRAGLLPAGE